MTLSQFLGPSLKRSSVTISSPLRTFSLGTLNHLPHKNSDFCETVILERPLVNGLRNSPRWAKSLSHPWQGHSYETEVVLTFQTILSASWILRTFVNTTWKWRVIWPFLIPDPQIMTYDWEVVFEVLGVVCYTIIDNQSTRLIVSKINSSQP